MKIRLIFKNIFFILLPLFLSGCLEILTSPVSPMTGLNIYDAYSISQDERGIYSIARDKFIKTKIQSKILASSGLSNVNIDVESFYGEVYLIGIVPDMAHKEKLIELAKNTQGVKKIYTYIRFDDDNKECQSNIKILIDLKNSLFKDSIVNGTNIRVSVVQCNVVFTGIINNIEQEKHAIWYAKHTDGVLDVYSFLRVMD